GDEMDRLILRPVTDGIRVPLGVALRCRSAFACFSHDRSFLATTQHWQPSFPLLHIEASRDDTKHDLALQELFANLYQNPFPREPPTRPHPRSSSARATRFISR